MLRSIPKVPRRQRAATLDRIIRRGANASRVTHAVMTPPRRRPHVLAEVQAEAVATWRAPAARRDRGARRRGGALVVRRLLAPPGVVIANYDRDALERLCRYGARLVFAQDRLSWTDDGRLAYRLKRSWPDGPHRTRDAAGRVSTPFVRHHSAPAPALDHLQRDDAISAVLVDDGRAAPSRRPDAVGSLFPSKATGASASRCTTQRAASGRRMLCGSRAYPRLARR